MPGKKKAFILGMIIIIIIIIIGYDISIKQKNTRLSNDFLSIYFWAIGYHERFGVYPSSLELLPPDHTVYQENKQRYEYKIMDDGNKFELCVQQYLLSEKYCKFYPE